MAWERARGQAGQGGGLGRAWEAGAAQALANGTPAAVGRMGSGRGAVVLEAEPDSASAEQERASNTCWGCWGVRRDSCPSRRVAFEEVS